MKVAIQARLEDGVAGGVQQIVIGMAQGLAQLTDGDEEYLFHCYPDSKEWLAPYMQGPCRLLEGTPLGKASGKGRLKRALLPVLNGDLMRYARLRLVGKVPRSDGSIELAGCEAVHFPYQAAFLTAVPSLYQPHDLQHLHYPAFFGLAERYWRERTYRAYCVQATEVVMMSHWGKQDIVSRYGLAPDKVAVIAGGAVNADYAPLSPQQALALRVRLKLPPAFLLYPAQAFEHKNHLRLFEALGLLKAQGLELPLICTGGLRPRVAQLRERAAALGIGVSFTGYLAPAELRSLYEMARGLVFPSKFEGWGLPVTEAFEAGLPVACARATSLPEHTGDAALLFDPDDAVDMAAALKRLWSEEALRGGLAAKGRQRAALYTWAKAARIFRAWYRQAAGKALNEEDRALVAASLAPLS